MLAPLRDYLRPRDPMSSPLLRATKGRYFTRMSIEFARSKPVFKESRWIVSEDTNVEHLLDVFTSADANADEFWHACFTFMAHLFWHKPRLTVLRQKIEGLSDGHKHKYQCLFELSRSLKSVGNRVEQKRYLNQILTLARERGHDAWVARVLRGLSDVNRMPGLFEEGIRQVREALEIYQRRGNALEQAKCSISLAGLLCSNNQPDAAEGAVSRAIQILPEEGNEFQVCRSHRLLGSIYRCKGERNKAIHHFETALAIAFTFDWRDMLFCIYYSLVVLFLDQRQFDRAHDYAERAKSHVANDARYLGRAMGLRAKIWYRQLRFKEAKSEALRAFETHQKLGAMKDVEDCRVFIQRLNKR